jgi:ferritin-like metal-binding protein YciE
MSNVWNRCSTSLAKRPRAKPARRFNGIVEEGQEIMEDFQESDALDAGLIAAGQAIEHYEMSPYGTLRTWAQQLGMRDAERLLDQTLAEEKKTDQLLTRLAKASANPKADKAA